jgi:methionyl-tRNA formyltransferase
MRWVLCGKNDAAAHALAFLVEKGDDVLAIATHGDDGHDGWQRSFRAEAARLGVPCERPRRINDAASIERLAAQRADALLSIQYDQILRDSLFQGVGCPCLNLHFALLPRHRGVAPIAWAVLAGDAEAGVTLHHMVEDIDAGDVIAQKSTAIRPDDTARDVYDRVSRAAVELFEDCYPFGAELLATRLQQDARVASYHRAGDFDFSRRTVDWTRDASSLHAWLRALIFPPLQRPETALGGRRLAIDGVAGSLLGPAGAPPGTVIGRPADGVDVAAGDRALRITRLIDLERPDSGEVAGQIAVGDRFDVGAGGGVA